MSRPTGVSLNDYCKAVEKCITARGYHRVKHYSKTGSIYTFEIFQNKDDSAPAIIWGIHTGHDKKRELYSDDLKKIYVKTAVPKEEFVKALEEITGKTNFRIGS